MIFMVRKQSLRKKTPREMFQKFEVKGTYTQRNLVERILDINPSSEALQIRVQLIPGSFMQHNVTMEEASRKWYKHGDFIRLSQPLTHAAAFNCRDIPFEIRRKDFKKLVDMHQEEINFLGYSWYPVQGKDRRKRVVQFPAITDGIQIFAYAENLGENIEIEDTYINSLRVRREGATILCRVPSRTKREPRYDVNLVHVPIDNGTEKRAIIWSLRSQHEEGREPKQRTFQNLRYTWENEPESSDIFTFDPHDVAAYVAVMGRFWKKHHVMTPMEMNPFALPSKLAYDFAMKLDNNVMIYDPTLAGKDKLRNLHLPEKAILQARLISVVGPDKSVFWDWDRDGKFKDYNKPLCVTSSE